MHTADHVEQARVVAYVFARDPELARVGAPILAYRRGFEPDQLGATAGEALITAPRQLVRTPVQCAVAAFHGMDRERVPHRETAHRHALPEQTAHLLRIVFEANVRRTELICAAPQLVQRAVYKMLHANSTAPSRSRLSNGSPRRLLGQRLAL